MKTKFTPWRLRETTVQDGSVLFQVLAGGVIAPLVIVDKRVQGDSPGTRAAFGQIVRDHNSAPEMLAALQQVDTITRTTVDLVADNMLTSSEADRQLIELNKLARAAIAKATGESV